MPSTTQKHGRPSEAAGGARGWLGVLVSLLGGIGILVAQQFIFWPVFANAVCFAPQANEGFRMTIGVGVASLVAVAAFVAARNANASVVQYVAIGLGAVIALGTVYFFGSADLPRADEILAACGREQWQSYLVVCLVFYPVLQAVGGMAAWRLRAKFSIRLIALVIGSAILSVLFVLAFSFSDPPNF